jgi:uncharacterized RDD family membrane protein YckC
MPARTGQVASFGARAAAWMVDAVPHALVPYFLTRLTDSIAIGIAGFLVTGILWSVLPEARTGMSVGKRLAWIRVANLRGEGRLGLARAALRWLVKYGVGGVLPVSYLWYFRDASRRTWHDHAAGTAVQSMRAVTSGRPG